MDKYYLIVDKEKINQPPNQSSNQPIQNSPKIIKQPF